jgi:hypothetical protein
MGFSAEKEYSGYQLKYLTEQAKVKMHGTQPFLRVKGFTPKVPILA